MEMTMGKKGESVSHSLSEESRHPRADTRLQMQLWLFDSLISVLRGSVRPARARMNRVHRLRYLGGWHISHARGDEPAKLPLKAIFGLYSTRARRSHIWIIHECLSSGAPRACAGEPWG